MTVDQLTSTPVCEQNFTFVEHIANKAGVNSSKGEINAGMPLQFGETANDFVKMFLD